MQDTNKEENKKRNYSFSHRNPEGLDSVESWDGQEFLIPATPGTWYWAILKYCYMYHDKYLTTDQVVDGSVEFYSGRDPDKFEKYKNKSSIKTVKNGIPISRQANDWKSRIITNIKTLTRHGGNNPYGHRLCEKGHRLIWANNKFILKTNISNLVTEEKNAQTSSSIQKNLATL